MGELGVPVILDWAEVAQLTEVEHIKISPEIDIVESLLSLENSNEQMTPK